uniref:Translation elongation factor EFTu-like domain-containing protein n=1 Tax=Hucho hucho TaxID=62062 RepID=A0A4W5JMJ1_9TELE
MPNAKWTNRTDNRILCNSTSGSGNDGFREHLFSAHTTPPRCTVHRLTKYEGQVGYVKAGMKEVNEAQIGDTLYHQKHPIEALPGFKPAKAMVFAGTLNRIRAGHVRERHKIRLQRPLQCCGETDTQRLQFDVQKDSSLALGAGWRLYHNNTNYIII